MNRWWPVYLAVPALMVRLVATAGRTGAAREDADDKAALLRQDEAFIRTPCSDSWVGRTQKGKTT